MNRRILVLALLMAVVGVVAYLNWQGPIHPKASEQEIVIASVIPLTGTAAEFGGYHREAVELFVDDYNQAHTGFRRIRHVFQDSKSTPKDGVSAAQSILFQQRPVAMQVQLSGVSMAVAPIAAEKRLLLFTIAGTGGARDVAEFAFRNYPAPETTAEETARVFIARKPDARVAILRINDEFGLSVASAFKRRLAHLSTSVVVEETFERTATDFRAPVTKALAGQPTTVYLVGFGNPMGRIIVQLRELGFTGDILGGPEIAFADVLTVAKEAAEGVKFLDLAFSAEGTEEPARSFVLRYRARFKRAPTAVAAVVYDGWSLIMHAIEKAGSTDPERVTATLKTTIDFAGVSGLLTVSPVRDVVYPLAPRVIRGGKAIAASDTQSQ